MKTLVTLSSFAKYDKRPLEILEKQGHEIIINPFGRKLNKRESLDLYADDIIAVIAGTEEISAEILKKASSLRVISRCGSGVDNIDLAAAKARNIAVFNTKTSVAEAVAELTVGLILNALRFINAADRSLRSGAWQRPMGYMLKDKTVGILGTGNVGKKVIELLSGFGVNFIAFDIREDKDLINKYDILYMDLDTLLSKSDIVSIHLPLTKESRNLISRDKLNLLKPDAFIINTSRGEIIDEAALYDCLRAKKIAAAALDVFSQEPYNGPLKELDNIILTTHIGSYARECRVEMEIQAANNLLKGLRKK